MRCADCKHFETGTGLGHRKVAGSGHCARWLHGYYIDPETMRRNEAWVEDDEGWGNVVGPEFGCVLFERK